VNSTQITRDAVLSPCGRYRYLLRRRWGLGPTLLYIMHNPSTADAQVDDATVRRCIAHARAAGYGAIAGDDRRYGAIEVVNLYAWRTPSPKALWAAAKAGEDIVGPGNDVAIGSALRVADAICVAWGAGAAATERAAAVLVLLTTLRVVCPRLPVLCLGRGRDGSPLHPLARVAHLHLQPFTAQSA